VPLILVVVLAVHVVRAAKQPDNKRPGAVAEVGEAEERTTGPRDLRPEGTPPSTQEKAKCFKSSIEREVDHAQRERNEFKKKFVEFEKKVIELEIVNENLESEVGVQSRS
jgi:hypothetical protein